MKLDTYENPNPGKTYISPSLPAFGQKDRSVRIASKLIEAPTTYAFAKIKDEIVLRHKSNGKSHIKAVFYEDDRRIRSLNIQGFTIATERPHNASFSFTGCKTNRWAIGRQSVARKSALLASGMVIPDAPRLQPNYWKKLS